MKKLLILFTVIVLTLVIFTGCQKDDIKYDENQSIEEEVNNAGEDLIKFESEKIDFTKVEYISAETQRNENLENTIINYLNYNGKLVYYYNNIDLNGDNKDEIFVYLLGQLVSGSGGTTSLIIEGENYEVISEFTLVQNPIIISKDKTNGWNDIIMQVTDGAQSSYVKLEFDGVKYPSNPSIATELDEYEVIKGVAIISNPVSIEDGLEIK